MKMYMHIKRKMKMKTTKKYQHRFRICDFQWVVAARDMSIYV